MPERKTRVQTMPGGPLVDGTQIPIDESEERWSKVKLEDGSVLKIRPVVTAVVRVDGQYDPEGNPVYVVKTMVVSAPIRHRARQKS
jgi:hypothetical protein